MVGSLLYRVVCKLLSVPAVLLRGEAAKDAELLVLRHENVVLRRQLTGPVRYEPADRFWFAVLSRLVHRSWWQARKWDHTARRTSLNRSSDQGARTPTR
ncbi:hypothetical protein [Lentzea sp. NPDC092896]|uniref:hypothetical protein n=1 Tax=Lentzea sp. NPDC092896 TaxID=3364127 RepID=UPI0037F5105E